MKPSCSPWIVPFSRLLATLAPLNADGWTRIPVLVIRTNP